MNISESLQGVTRIFLDARAIFASGSAQLPPLEEFGTTATVEEQSVPQIW
ncbi:MAG: hypothetical protein F6K62_26785, partial [Sphaerospermopsis sp. SIO1G2]|nr:hypothetical protein [Sphaerospermopsis sp. SIO1G2]